MSIRSFGLGVQYLLQRLSFMLIVCSAFGSLVLCVLAAFDVLPWLQFSVRYGDVTYDNAGIIAQIGLTVLTVMLSFFLPTNRRMMALENSHRSFNIGMNDVARAYAAAHAADRHQMFQMSSEFDSVRERLSYLRDHPDLGSLEPTVLEVAAQMSHLSKELADVYSDDKVMRARGFLEQRQQEVLRFNERLEQAKQTSRELKHWLHEVELEESVAASQLARLRGELHEVLPELGHEETYTAPRNVIGLSNKAAE